jgi:quinolinate synthase
VHDRLTEEEVEKMKKRHPNALLAAHPECTEKVLSHADYIGSTKGILEYVRGSSEKEFIIATEKGVVDKLSEEFPDKKIHLAYPGMVCVNMKKTTLEKVLSALENEEHKVDLDKEVMDKAKKSLERMIEAVG